MVVCQDNDVIVNEESIVSSVMEELVSKVLFDCPGEEISDPALQRYRYCASFIRKIQREQFGVGLKFGVEEGKLIEIFRERQGRSLHRLSQELYTKDSHFVLELIQNADDNEYPDDMLEKPTVAFIVESDKITILNNEKGFQEKHVKALCDVGKSTKGIHRKGYIGKKFFIDLNFWNHYTDFRGWYYKSTCVHLYVDLFWGLHEIFLKYGAKI